jgi:hypothetical protein
MGQGGKPQRCRPRRDSPVCPHGVTLACNAVHAEDDDCLGEPICRECFDYDGALIWNNLLGELWRRTTIYLPRKLARQLGVTQKRLKQLVRAAYVKVAEYQHRGLVHVHVVIRLDRAMPKYRRDVVRAPDARFTMQLLEDALRAAAAAVTVPVPAEVGGGSITWGAQLDVQHIGVGRALEPGRCAGYLAKYATKATEQAGGVCIGSPSMTSISCPCDLTCASTYGVRSSWIRNSTAGAWRATRTRSATAVTASRSSGATRRRSSRCAPTARRSCSPRS